MLEQFIHRHVPPQREESGRTLLLLHGTGGSEEDLLGIGETLDPDARLLSPRGRVLENGMPRFFRRLREGVFDEEDVRVRSHELADFVQDAAKAYAFDTAGVVAVGYSNGANIAGGMLLLRPNVLGGAILFKPMVPLIPDELPDLTDLPILVCAGRQDPLVAPKETERLVRLLESTGANVSLYWYAGGHELSREEVRRAAEWLASFSPQTDA